MKNYSDIKPLRYKTLQGISEKTLEIHYGKLYVGYVNKYKEIQERLKMVDISKANASFSDYRAMKLEEGFTADAVLLHEAYFDILGGDGTPRGGVVEKIKTDFGSYENWEKELKALSLASRGWALTVYDFNDGKLHNYIADIHNQGGIWGTLPIVVVDVYEHAYFIDYGPDRAKYLEALFSNFDWSVIDKKYQKTISS